MHHGKAMYSHSDADWLESDDRRDFPVISTSDCSIQIDNKKSKVKSIVNNEKSNSYPTSIPWVCTISKEEHEALFLIPPVLCSDSMPKDSVNNDIDNNGSSSNPAADLLNYMCDYIDDDARSFVLKSADEKVDSKSCKNEQTGGSSSSDSKATTMDSENQVEQNYGVDVDMDKAVFPVHYCLKRFAERSLLCEKVRRERLRNLGKNSTTKNEGNNACSKIPTESIDPSMTERWYMRAWEYRMNLKGQSLVRDYNRPTEKADDEERSTSESLLQPEDIDEPIFREQNNNSENSQICADLPFVDWKFMSNFLSPFILDSLRNCLCWFFIGDAPGTGTGWHFDPIGTSAWLYLIAGRKQWEVDLDVELVEEEDMKFLPKELQKSIFEIRQKKKTDDASDSGRKRRKIDDNTDISTEKQKSIIKFRTSQSPGQILYVPSQSHHRVRNILSEGCDEELGEVAVAVTHNFLDKSNFRFFLNDMKAGLETIIKYDYTEDSCFESENVGPLVFAGIVGMLKHLEVILKNADDDTDDPGSELDIRTHENGSKVLDLLLKVADMDGWDVDS